MDLFTVIGAIVGFFMVTFIGITLCGGNIIEFFDPASIAITIGGTLCAILISFPAGTLKTIGKVFSKVAKNIKVNPKETILTIVSFSEKARREGLLALEDDLDQLDDEFMRKGIQLVVDGTDPELVRKILENELGYMEARHATGKQMFEDIGYLAPTFGMLGTLIGLIVMLKNITDKATVGQGMATALITTYYGAIIANLYAIPISNKLRERNNDEVLLREIMIEGILAIQSGDNPRIVKDRLVSFLAPKDRREISQESGEK